MQPESEPVRQPTVLIVTDDVEFSRRLSARWQEEQNLNAFAVVGSDVCQQLKTAAFDLAIVGGVKINQLHAVARTLVSLSSASLFVCENSRIADCVRAEHPRALVLAEYEGWPEAAVLVAQETLRRCEAVDRARRAEQANACLDRQATLGRYMLEMRHTLNNALTSVLGNAELLLLEPGCLSAETRSQVEIIRNMALRMNEIIRRFTSIEKELAALEKANHDPARERAQVAGAAS